MSKIRAEAPTTEYKSSKRSYSKNRVPDNKELEALFCDCVERGIIRLDDVMNSGKEDIMKSILDSVHPYKISKAADGRCVTYVPDETKPNGRRQIRKQSMSEMFRFLLGFYHLNENLKGNLLFSELFTEWISYKSQFIGAKNAKRGLSPSTIRRYERDFDKFIAGTPLAETRIDDLTMPTIQTALAKIIQNGEMSERCASNVIGYVRQTLEYAYWQKYTIEDFSRAINRNLLLSQCVYEEEKPDEERVLTIKELALYQKAVLDHEAKHPYYMPDYAIELAILTGMRVGEIAALKWCNIQDGMIRVRIAERRFDYKDKPSELVIGDPKKHKYRDIQTTEYIEDLFGRVRSLGMESPEDFVFVRKDGRRYTAHDIGCAADRRAKEAGLERGSIHCIRRTVSSLLNNVLPQKAVSEILGHSELVNKRFYQYSTAEKQEKAAALGKVSSSVINFPLNPDMKKEQKA